MLLLLLHDGCRRGHGEAWHGTSRVFAADSWFASVKTAEALAEKGLYFIGDVKTATRRFCGEALVSTDFDTCTITGTFDSRASMVKEMVKEA